jgi:hypothetical protein
VQSPCNSLIEYCIEIFYMIDEGDTPSIQCKMNLRRPQCTRKVDCQSFIFKYQMLDINFFSPGSFFTFIRQQPLKHAKIKTAIMDPSSADFQNLHDYYQIRCERSAAQGYPKTISLDLLQSLTKRQWTHEIATRKIRL